LKKNEVPIVDISHKSIHSLVRKERDTLYIVSIGRGTRVRLCNVFQVDVCNTITVNSALASKITVIVIHDSDRVASTGLCNIVNVV
jgi:hypothetical protein